MTELVLVTGGSRGIGKAITQLFIDKEYDVIFTYRKNEEQAKEFEKNSNGKAKAYRVDGSDWNEIEKFARLILKDRAPGILINNAGLNVDSLFFDMQLEDFWEIMRTNLGSTIAFCKFCVPAMMQKRKGSIINIASVSARKVVLGNTAYGVSKAAIERFSKGLALELARFNVRVNCLAPGYVETDMLKGFLNGNDRKELLKRIPTRTILSPQAVAQFVFDIVEGRLETTGTTFYIGNGENINC